MMMKYFAIEYSHNEKIMGKIPQIKEFIRHCHVDDEPHFIDKFYFRRIDINPILSNGVLYANAKQTDLIQVGGIGFSSGSIVISDKLKRILEQFNCYGLQFFPTHIIQKEEVYDNYWQTHIYKNPFEYVDFKKTKIFIKNSETRKIITESLEILNVEDFLSMVDSLEYPKTINLKDILFEDKMNLDFFQIRFFENGGHRGIVSERLKFAIEEEGITGIEFRPIELSLQEWHHSGEREKVYGKL